MRTGSPPKVLSLSSASPCMQVLTTAPCPPQVLSLSSVSPQQLEAVAEAEAEAEAEEAFAPWGELGAVAGAVAAPRALCKRKRLGWPRMASDYL
jgi:hypothetical protein